MKFPMNFICATKEYNTLKKHVSAPYIRKSFICDEKPAAASITICGLGFYELFVNGIRITKGFLAPYISIPDHLLYYDTYDIKKYLQTGENVIGVILGNGLQNNPGGDIWHFDIARWRSAPKMAMGLDMIFSDNKKVTIESDESFKTTSSPIYFDDLRYGEFYDARKEIKGWNEPGFDDSQWSHVIKAEIPRGEATICKADPILATTDLIAVSIKKACICHQYSTDNRVETVHLPEDEMQERGYLYDFGVNAAGLCRLKIKGREGQKVILQFGETLKDGNLSLESMLFAPHGYNHRDIYICKGENEEIYMPRFTYHGFQYCLVIGITEEQATESLLTYVVMNSDLVARGGFSCSNPIANGLQDATRRSSLANFYYFPTDCPHREKNGWTGDAALSAEHMLLNLSVENSFKEWMHNIRKAQNEEGSIPGIVPSDGEVYDSGPAWDSVLTMIPYMTYIYRDDKEIIVENETAIFRYLNYIATKRNDAGLINFGFGDWCTIGRDFGDYKAPVLLTSTVMAMNICEQAAFMFNTINQIEQRDFANDLFMQFRKAIRDRLINFNTMTALGNCQTAQAMAIYYDVFDKSEKQQAFQRLLEMIKSNNEKMDVGVLGARVIFHVLTDFEYSDLAFDMITSTRFPSYGNWIERGATSLWESFFDVDEVPASKNHHFFGDISAWFIKAISGIRLNPNRNNVNEVNIIPSFIRSLTFAKGYHIAPAGTIKVEWTRKAEKIILDIQVPERMMGKVILPFGYTFENGLATMNLINGSFEIS